MQFFIGYFCLWMVGQPTWSVVNFWFLICRLGFLRSTPSHWLAVIARCSRRGHMGWWLISAGMAPRHLAAVVWHHPAIKSLTTQHHHFTRCAPLPMQFLLTTQHQYRAVPTIPLTSQATTWASPVPAASHMVYQLRILIHKQVLIICSLTDGNRKFHV